MKHTCCYFIFYISIFIINVVCTKITPINPLISIDTICEVKPDDAYYLVLIKTVNKQSAIDAIHNLIMENKNTYKDIKEFENKQIEHEADRDKYLMDYGYSAYVYEISHVKDESMIYAYLSFDLVEKVNALPMVISCFPDKKIRFFD